MTDGDLIGAFGVIGVLGCIAMIIWLIVTRGDDAPRS